MGRDRPPRARSASTPVAPLTEQLERLFARLRRRHPDLLGIGLGSRRRRGRLLPELTVKLEVSRKNRKLARGRRLPPSVVLTTLALGQPVRVRVPTDVEPRRRPMFSAFAVGRMTAAALATWPDGAGRAYGIVTAAHGLEADTVPVTLRDGSQVAGSVVARADLAQDGLDAGLVRVPVASPDRLADVGPVSVDPATADELLLSLSSSNQDAIGTDAETWAGPTPVAISAVAFYVCWQWAGIAGTLRNVVECHAPLDGVFAPGTSGSMWVTAATGSPPRRAMAIQSHGFGPLFRVAEGTHFLSALEWLRKLPAFAEIEVAWKAADL